MPLNSDSSKMYLCLDSETCSALGLTNSDSSKMYLCLDARTLKSPRQAIVILVKCICA